MFRLIIRDSGKAIQFNQVSLRIKKEWEGLRRTPRVYMMLIINWGSYEIPSSLDGFMISSFGVSDVNNAFLPPV